MRPADVGRFEASVYRYSTTKVLDTDDLVKGTSTADGKETKNLILGRSMRMVLDDPGFQVYGGTWC